MEKNITNLKTLDSFIFIHDQEILVDFLNKNRFHDLENFKWVFLGSRPADKIVHLENLIIARDLPINIEQYPKFTSLTGWYALYKNGFLKTDYVNLFEYDISYIKGFVDINKEMLKRDFDFIGYFPMVVSDVVYIRESQYSIELTNAIKSKTGVDVVEMINKMSPNAYWSSSSNSTWKVDKLKNYLDWFEQFIDDIKESKFCGHMHERSLSFYYFIANLKVQLQKNLMIHVQLNSHGTSPLPPERAKQMYNLLK